MAAENERLQKLAGIATDIKISPELRTQAITQLGSIGTHASLVALLDMVANEAFPREERWLALRQAEKILKPQRSWWQAFKPRSSG